MLRYFCFIFLISFNLSLFSQSYIGFGADNFNGVHGILTNPANIADSRSLVDINLASASIFTTNSYFELDYYGLLVDDEIEFEEQSTRVGVDRINYGALNIDILGPSVLISLSDKHSIALSTRARGIANINNADGEVVNFFENEDIREITEPLIANDVNASAIVNTWIEYGITYARVLNDNKRHFLKGGATLKYLSGYGSGQGETDDVLLAYSPNNNAVDNVLFRGDVSYNYSSNLDSNENFIPFEGDDNFEFKETTWGVGLDLGLVYEYRPNHRQNISRSNVKEQVVIRHKSTYKYKVGLSILDIGALNYRDSREANANLNDINIDTLLDGDFDEEVKPALGVTDQLVDQRILLPTTIRADIDIKLKDKFYLNTTSRLSLYSKNNTRANRTVNQVTVSPRYETKWFTAFSPITYTQFGGVQWGLGGRLGPIFIGSSGAISHILIDNQTRAFDVYAGIKIPIFHKTPKPRAEDDPTGGYKSDCNGCLEKDKKQPTKPLGHYNGLVK